MLADELEPDLGPGWPHADRPAASSSPRGRRSPRSTSSSTGADLEAAEAIAARLRESGGGPPGVRAIAIELGAGADADLDQRPRSRPSITARPASSTSPRAWPASTAPRPSPPSSSGSSRRRRSTATPRTCRSPATTRTAGPSRRTSTALEPWRRAGHLGFRADAGQPEAAQPQAPGHPDGEHQPRAALPPAQPPGGDGAGPQPQQPGGRRQAQRRSTAATRRRPGAGRSSAALLFARCSCSRSRCCSASRSAGGDRAHVIAAVFYIPLGYYTEKFFYDRRQAKLSRGARRRQQAARRARR